MLGLLIAAVYTAVAILAWGVEYAPQAVHTSASIAFWWYAVWAALISLPIVLFFLGGLGAVGYGLATGSAKSAGVGTLIGAASLLVATLHALSSGLWIAGSLLVYNAAPAELGPTFDGWNVTMLIVAGVLFIIGALCQIMGNASSRSTENK